jgi:hypothetical protein
LLPDFVDGCFDRIPPVRLCVTDHSAVVSRPIL